MTILVCIDDNAKSARLLKEAQLKANQLHTNWIAFFVDTEQHGSSYRGQGAASALFAKVKDMGGEMISSKGKNIASAIADYVNHAASHGTTITHIIVGQTPRSGFFKELTATTGEKIMHKLRRTSIEISTIHLTGEHYSPSWYDRLKWQTFHISDAGIIAASTFVALLCAYASQKYSLIFYDNHLSYPVLIVFQLAILFTTLRAGLTAGLISVVLNSIVVDMLFINPVNSIAIATDEQRTLFILFIICSVIVMSFGAYSHANRKALLHRERSVLALSHMYRASAEASSVTESLRILHKQLKQSLGMDIIFFMPDIKNVDNLVISYPYEHDISPSDIQHVQELWHTAKHHTGGKKPARIHSTWRFHIMNGAVIPHIGVLAIRAERHMSMNISSVRLFDALTDQCAAIVERIILTDTQHQEQIVAEREKLRVMLLSSVSHDLKTPLASVIGALSVFQRMKKSGKLDNDTANELIKTAYDEASRLDGFITNILDMTRIESGDIAFDCEWVSVVDMVEKVRKRISHRLQQRTLTITAPVELIEVWADMMLSEQLFYNVIDNAIKYSKDATKIDIHFTSNDSGCTVHIRDFGCGVPISKVEDIFNKYERLKQTDSTVAGTGLGLAIAREIMTRQGGTITATPHLGGTDFTICFSKWRVNPESATISNAG